MALVGLVAVVAVVLVVVAAVLFVGGRPDGGESRSPSPTGGAARSSDLAGEWSGTGLLARCAGLGDDGCPETLPVTLAIDCRGERCVVTPFGRRYGSPALEFRKGRYRAAGPVPADAAPTCGGVPTSSASWRLDFTVADGRLRGSYAEATVQGFDCGATGVAWTVSLERG